MQISIIIPTLNEDENLERLIPHLQAHAPGNSSEILVVDGGSTDATISCARRLGVQLLQSPQACRAVQLNLGARAARGDILYFVHADTLPPASFMADIEKALAEGYALGCYRFRFDSDRWLLKLNAFFTRFDQPFFRGGDQSLFISQPLFWKIGGFREDYIIMEEYEFLERARQEHAFKIIPKDILVSARKYEENGYLTVQWANYQVFKAYRQGASPEFLYHRYRQLLQHRS